MNMFELNFYQDQDKWKHNLIPIEISEEESDRVVDLLIYKNNYAFNKKIKVFLGDHIKNFICRRCLNSYTNENALINHKKNVEMIIDALLEDQANHIFNGINIFIRILYILGFMQILKLIMKSIILLWIIKQLKFIRKIRY